MKNNKGAEEGDRRSSKKHIDADLVVVRRKREQEESSRRTEKSKDMTE